MTQLILLGNPNCGKTTLFNALTGQNQRIGNWPGVTVEKKTGSFFINNTLFELHDLPGTYSLTVHVDSTSQDERITAKAITSIQADCIINVIDACHLERHLYLTSQILELGKPVIVVLNMYDIAQQRSISININKLANDLGCPVIPLQAHKKIGFYELENALLAISPLRNSWTLSLPKTVQNDLMELTKNLIQQGINPALASYYSQRIAEGDELLHSMSLNSKQDFEDFDIILADARYQKIHELTQLVQNKKNDASENLTAKIDRVVLHRFWGLPLFFGMMYLMFLFAIDIGGAFQDFFNIMSETIFVQGSSYLFAQINMPSWFIAIFSYGVGKGINTTLTFIPVIAAMYFFLSLLETSGYMARAAFVIDKFMRILGLPGKSFVPLIVGFGCNVPAVMAARTLDSERDRLLTILMSPFMSCSARLAIYAVFVAAFFPHGGHNVIFSLYVIGILMAVITGFILRRSILKGHVAPLILELPAYHKPSFKRLIKETSFRLRFFILRASKVIVPVCLILGALNSIGIHGDLNVEGSPQSVLALIGQWLTPLFTPMGIEQNNWPATVGLLTGMLAKEVVIGTLNSLYSQTIHLNEVLVSSFDFWGNLQTAVWTIPHNIISVLHTLINPFTSSAPVELFENTVYGTMLNRFDGKIGAYSYLLFVLLYIPCVSTMAVIRQESTRKLMWFSIIWSIIVAYGVAVGFYQFAHLLDNSLEKNCSFISLFLVCGGLLRYLFNKYYKEHFYAIRNP